MNQYVDTIHLFVLFHHFRAGYWAQACVSCWFVAISTKKVAKFLLLMVLTIIVARAAGCRLCIVNIKCDLFVRSGSSRYNKKKVPISQCAKTVHWKPS